MVSLTASLEKTLERSLQLAAERKHAYATLEHLLLALADDEHAAEVMTACRVDIDKLRRDIIDYLDNDCGSFVVEGGGHVHPTAAFQRVVQRAVLHVESSSKDEVTGANVLVSIFAERDSHAAWFLTEQSMTRYDAVSYISRGVKKTASEATPETAEDDAEETGPAARVRLAERIAAVRARVAQTTGRENTPPFYLVRISGIETAASIGIHGFEQATRQKVLVSVALLLEKPATVRDEIGAVLDYDFVREGVLDLTGGRHFNLQETLCEAILDLCLAQSGVLGAVVQTDKADVYPGVSGVACRMARMGARLDGFPWWEIPV